LLRTTFSGPVCLGIPKRDQGFLVAPTVTRNSSRFTASVRQALGLPVADMQGIAMTTEPITTVRADDGTLIDVRAVAAMLTCSTRHVIRLADAGRMPSPLKLGSLVRWRRQEVLDWIGRGCRDQRNRVS
jgi:excisionase family DNA binding protein